MNEFMPVRIVDSAPAIYAVRIDGNQMGATLRSLCAMLDLARHAQSARIRRDSALAGALIIVLLDSPGGQQQTEVLLSWAIPIWLSGLNTTRLSEEKQALALHIQQKAVDLIEKAFNKPEEAAAPPSPGLSSPSATVWEEGYLFIDHLKAEHEDMRRQSLTEQQDVLKRMAVVEYNQEVHAQRLAALEAGQIHSTMGLAAEHLMHIYLLARRVRARLGYRVSDTLAGLADHLHVEDVSDLPESAWPAVLTWFESLLTG